MHHFSIIELRMINISIRFISRLQKTFSFETSSRHKLGNDSYNQL